MVLLKNWLTIMNGTNFTFRSHQSLCNHLSSALQPANGIAVRYFTEMLFDADQKMNLVHM